MEGLVIILVLAVIITAIILPLVNCGRIGALKTKLDLQNYDLQRQIDELKETISLLHKTGKSESTAKNQTSRSDKPQTYHKIATNTQSEPAVFLTETDDQETVNLWLQDSQTTSTPQPTLEPSKADINKGSHPESEKPSLEQQFGARLPVWAGGIALALAGFFLVKYSIDNNLLSPTVRVLFGSLLGLGLLYSANAIHQREYFANGKRIAQSLAGAGIAVLYLVGFAASRLYHLIPDLAGFAAMAAVTALAIILSLRQGPAIALMGMTGGFLTPALLDVQTNAFTVFIYLYFTASGLLFVARKTSAWWLSLPTIAASLIWVLSWLVTSYNTGDSLWLSLFLLAISCTIVMNSREILAQQQSSSNKQNYNFVAMLNTVALTATLLIMGLITAKAEFGLLEWGLYGLLAIASITLAWFNDRQYGFVPWIAMLVNAVMLLAWDPQDLDLWALIMATFASIYLIAGYQFTFKSNRPVLWAGLFSATALIYYLTAYYKLHKPTEDIPLLWGVTALIMAGLSLRALFKVRIARAENDKLEQLLAIFTLSVTAFISLALFIELDREFFSVAIAAETLAITYINSKTSIKALRPIAAVLAMVFGLLLLPQILLLFQLTLYSLFEAKINLQTTVPIVQWPVFQLGLPALFFIAGSRLLLQQADGKLVRILEISAVALIAVMGYYFTRNSLHADANVLFIKAGFFERGFITNILFLYGLFCLWLGDKAQRNSVLWSGLVLTVVAMFRIIYFDLLLHNPLWAEQSIAGRPLFNSLLLPYGLPIIWSIILANKLEQLEHNAWLRFTRGLQLVLLFALISMNVRYWFHGEYLSTGATSNVEIYCYSVVWLLLGIGLLLAGIFRQAKSLRYASLAIMLVTVAKVFLYDAAELDGLYRVFSFLGLGVSLIGLSYFYARFVSDRR